MTPTLGTLSSLGPGGRFGMVLGTRPVGPEQDGQQLVSVRMRAMDGRDSEGFRAPATKTPQPASPPTHRSPERTPDRLVPPVAVAKPLDDLSPAEKQEVARLQQRDAQVKQEENAHAGGAGDLAGPIQYVYATGPDGRQYAVGGGVSIRAAAVTGDPLELRRMGARLAAAAHAAVNPSAQDLAAARSGLNLYAQAGRESKVQPPSVDISV